MASAPLIRSTWRAWDLLRSFNVCAAGFYCFVAYEVDSVPVRIAFAGCCAASVLLAANAHRMCKRFKRRGAPPQEPGNG